MKKCRFSLLAAVAMAASFAFADANDLRVIFSTQGPDTYADGTTVVAENEWYGLVWLADADITLAVDTELNAVDATTSEVVLAAPLAKDGKCPPVLFLLDSAKKKTSGIYRVYLLDTRDNSGNPAAKDPATGKPVRVNAVQATTAQAAATADTISISVSNKTIDSTVAAVETDTSNIPDPTIESFDASGDQVQIKVSGMVSSVNYVIKKGADLKSITTTEITLDAGDNGEDIFIDKDDAKFFSIGRKPIK